MAIANNEYIVQIPKCQRQQPSSSISCSSSMIIMITSMILMMIITIQINIEQVNGCYCSGEQSAGHYCGSELIDCEQNDIVYECDQDDDGGDNNNGRRSSSRFQIEHRRRRQRRPVKRQVADCRQTSCIRSTSKDWASCWQKLSTSIVVMPNK